MINHFKEDLIQLRKKMGLSQQQLADRLFVSQNTISQYETGARCLTVDMFFLILGAMGISLSYQFINDNGDDLTLKTTKPNIPNEPIDFRAIRSEEGFRLWALQNNPESIYVDINDKHFIVHKKRIEGALFWLYLDDFDVDKLIQICMEENIEYEEI